jgi:hypothetical protein
MLLVNHIKYAVSTRKNKFYFVQKSEQRNQQVGNYSITIPVRYERHLTTMFPAHIVPKNSVADPGCLYWILDPGSRIQIFPSLIPDPRSKRSGSVFNYI